MKNCPNIDKNTLNIIKKIGLDSSIKNRAILFYSICVIVRLLIAGLEYQFRNKK